MSDEVEKALTGIAEYVRSHKRTEHNQRIVKATLAYLEVLVEVGEDEYRPHFDNLKAAYEQQPTD